MSTKPELIEKIARLEEQLMRADTVITDLRHRNADLRNAAEAHSFEAGEAVAPSKGIPDRRYNKIWRLTETAVDMVNSPAEKYEEFMFKIVAEATAIRDYFSTYYGEVEKKQLSAEHIAAMQAGRRAKKLDAV